jgi:hypothetical protein
MSRQSLNRISTEQRVANFKLPFLAATLETEAVVVDCNDRPRQFGSVQSEIDPLIAWYSVS